MHQLAVVTAGAETGSRRSAEGQMAPPEKRVQGEVDEEPREPGPCWEESAVGSHPAVCSVTPPPSPAPGALLKRVAFIEDLLLGRPASVCGLG